jgi:HAE1 family hydrophobic/amphiphilic exporter-1
VVITKYEGGSPEEIEKAITIHLEEALSSLPSLQDIVSSSRDGLSIVTAQFHWDIDHRFTLLRIREKIDAVFDRFPKGTDRPFIMDFNPGSLPVMELILTGDTDLLSLGDFARDVLKPRFSQIEGIAAATITGYSEEAVQIEMNSSECVRLGITAEQIIQSIQDNLPAQPISSLVRVGYAEYPITVKFSYQSPQDLLQIPIQNPEQIPVTLSDVAQIQVKPLKHHSLVYRDFTPSLAIQLFKESGASTVNATRSALKLIDELSETYPDMKLTVLKNRGEFVEQSIAGLKQAILVGAGLAFLIILLFLQNFRYAVLLSTVIPVSLLFAFNALYLHGISLNIMTLGGLALGLGLIVDNGIVVIESIFNEMRKEPSLHSVVRGVQKVSRAITGSTLTTVAIFLPIVYVKGYASVLFKQQALTISYTLMISLLAAVFLIPAAYHFFLFHRSRGKKPTGESGRFSILKPVYSGFQNVFNKTESVYHRGLEWALDHKKATMGFLTGFFVFAGILFTLLSKQYWPSVPSARVEIKAAVPYSIPYEIVKDQTEKTIANLHGLENVSGLTARLVDPRDVRIENIQDVMNSPGDYTVYFSLELSEPLSPDRFNRQVYLDRIELSYSDISVYQPPVLNQGVINQSKKNFTVYISGENSTVVRETAFALADFFQSFDYLNDITAEIGGVQIVKSAKLDPRRLSFYRQTPKQLAHDLLIRTSEKEIGVWQEKLHSIPVVARWDTAGVKPMKDIMESILAPGKSLLRTEQLLSIENALKAREVIRVNRKRVAFVSANVPAYRLGDAVEQLNLFKQQHNPAGITLSVAGESERIAKSYRDLFLAFVMAVILVYLILAAQFESFIHPFNIILTVPVGLAGAVLGLIVFQQSLNVISLIGIVMLIGIGVNDAIIKVDYMNFLHRRNNYALRDAILETSRDKFRPVMMTTLTTIVAMLPMAFGFGGNVEMNQPLAITIISGLSFTTVVTLIITPVIYEAGEKLRFRAAHPKKDR